MHLDTNGCEIYRRLLFSATSHLDCSCIFARFMHIQYASFLSTPSRACYMRLLFHKCKTRALDSICLSKADDTRHLLIIRDADKNSSRIYLEISLNFSSFYQQGKQMQHGIQVSFDKALSMSVCLAPLLCTWCDDVQATSLNFLRSKGKAWFCWTDLAV